MLSQCRFEMVRPELPISLLVVFVMFSNDKTDPVRPPGGFYRSTLMIFLPPVAFSRKSEHSGRRKLPNDMETSDYRMVILLRGVTMDSVNYLDLYLLAVQCFSPESEILS